jgi:hypothetical protein
MMRPCVEFPDVFEAFRESVVGLTQPGKIIYLIGKTRLGRAITSIVSSRSLARYR